MSSVSATPSKIGFVRVYTDVHPDSGPCWCIHTGFSNAEEESVAEAITSRAFSEVKSILLSKEREPATVAWFNRGEWATDGACEEWHTMLREALQETVDAAEGGTRDPWDQCSLDIYKQEPHGSLVDEHGSESSGGGTSIVGRMLTAMTLGLASCLIGEDIEDEEGGRWI